MGWSINLVKNTVVVPREYAGKLFEAGSEYFMDDPDCVLDEDDNLMFDDDAMEHMDYLHDDRIRAVLAEAKVSGQIAFSSGEGDNGGSWWSYNFTNGVCEEKRGELGDLIPG